MYNIVIEGIVKEELIMKVIVRGKNVTITDAIEDKIIKNLALLDKYFIMGQDVEAKVLIRSYNSYRVCSSSCRRNK